MKISSVTRGVGGFAVAIYGVRMSRVRAHNFSISLDGFGTGEAQTMDAPFGHAGQRLHEWFFPTRTFQSMIGQPGGTTGIDDAFASNWAPGIGVEIMGRGKFGPQHGPWHDEDWIGWWGPNPPFHTPVIVLTHHPRPPLELDGDTTFHFLDASPADALAAARELAPDLDVRIGGGVRTLRDFLAADLIDHLHLVVVPIALGRGERLWDALEDVMDHFAVEAVTSPTGVTHLTLTRRS
jgi:dihydrofolate reductase